MSGSVRLVTPPGVNRQRAPRSRLPLGSRLPSLPLPMQDREPARPSQLCNRRSRVGGQGSLGAGRFVMRRRIGLEVGPPDDSSVMEAIVAALVETPRFVAEHKRDPRWLTSVAGLSRGWLRWR